MEDNYEVRIKAHKSVMPTQKEVMEALRDLVKSKIDAQRKPTPKKQAFEVDVVSPVEGRGLTGTWRFP